MNDAIEIFAISCGACAIGAVARKMKALSALAFQAGRRAALREAIRLADLRADLAAELAPCGRLGQGLVRAQVAHEIALELRDLLEAQS